MIVENIFIIEDDQDVLELIKLTLEQEGFCVTGMISGEDALNVIKSFLPDLIVLDLMLPGINGLEVCKILKNDPKTAGVPIIMLTSKGAEEDMVTGLELGADDYIVKPFSSKVLIARIKAVLRRDSKTLVGKNSCIKKQDLIIDPDRYEVFVKNKSVNLSSTEFKILHFLALSPGRVYNRLQIINSVWGEDHDATERSLDVLIAGLRKKLDTAGHYIETVRGVGYCFKE